MQLNFVLDQGYPDLSCYITKDTVLTKEGIDLFQKIIYDFYRKSGRDFAWRNTQDPYKIVVSEIMLQQTQTDRVKEKYDQFIATFPDFNSLANASVAQVMSCWQGLGYNRRGLSVQACAQRVVTEYNGTLPDNPDILIEFKGIGKATAASICAFAFNKPTVFIETNIRAVFIYTFFRDQDNISDAMLMPLVEQTLDKLNTRVWYYALMDYGVMLKKLFTNPSRKSKHHTKQSKFEGSDRQIRGMIIKLLTQRQAKASREDFYSTLARESVRIDRALDQLMHEGFITQKNGMFSLAS